MEKNYNYSRSKMFLPEYGRHIHEMVDYLSTIEDRAERTRQAHIVIDVMGNLNPLLRDTSDIAHKLWDHLFIMADFRLDVDSPYPIPSQQDLRPRPEKLAYPRKDMMFKHYGKSVEKMIGSLKNNPDEAAVEETLENIARYMRTKSYEYNQEHPNNDIIIGDIRQMSRGELVLDEKALGSLKSEYRHSAAPTSKKGAGRGQGQHHGSGGRGSKNGRSGGGHGSGGQKRGRAFLFLAAVLMGMLSCTKDGATLRGSFVGAQRQSVYLEVVEPGGPGATDSVVTDAKGEFSFRVDLPDGQPTIFNLRHGADMVPLLISPGEKVKVTSLGDLEHGYRVSGSPESELVARLHSLLTNGAASLDSINGIFAMGNSDDGRRRELMRTYYNEYRRIKREQIRFIVENSSSLAAVYALYQRLPGEKELLGGDTDHVYYRVVADSVQGRYPDSKYVAALRRQVDSHSAGMNLLGTIERDGIEEVSYPDLDLPDMYGKKVRLSSLAGSVILLDFWSATRPESRLDNAELKELWGKWADRGLAVYQVSLDTSKPLWVNAVLEQKLPWITVCDFVGPQSMAARMWNVQSLPANFLIDRQGNITGKNLYGEELDEAVSRSVAQN